MIAHTIEVKGRAGWVVYWAFSGTGARAIRDAKLAELRATLPHEFRAGAVPLTKLRRIQYPTEADLKDAEPVTPSPKRRKEARRATAPQAVAVA